MNDHRERLIEAAERAYWRERVKEMSDAELEAHLCSSLGLPPGTTFTDDQLEMIQQYRG